MAKSGEMVLDCAKCGQKKVFSEFREDPRTPTGRFHWCRDCVNTYNRSRYQDRKAEQQKFDHDRWARAREAELKSAGGYCVCCKERELGFLRVLKKVVWCFNCSAAVRRFGVCPHKRN
jgi:hypothetical protein